MPDKNPTKRSTNGDDYIRRIRKDVAKRQLERAAKRTENSDEKTKQEDKTPSPKPTS